MNRAEQALESLYAQALQAHLAGAGESALQRAYELGRRAIADGLGVLETITAYTEAARAVLREAGAEDNVIRKFDALHDFLIESLSPFEITHRSFRETNAALRRLNHVLEEETKRIAHILHDDASQLLAAVHIALADLAHELPENIVGRVDEIRMHLDQIEGQLRRLSHELRPTILDDLGLIPAIEFLSEGITKRTGLNVIVDGSTDGRLPASIETTLYRIVQEGLVNAAKHANATHAVVQLSREPRWVRCAVRDNGGGFDLQVVETKKGDRGIGLLAVRERVNALGGTFKVNTSRGNGTELLIAVPTED